MIYWPHSAPPWHLRATQLRNKYKGWKLILQRENGGVFVSDFTISVLAKAAGKKAATSLMAVMLEADGVSPDPTRAQDQTLH